jgi:hypothetical protein
MWENFGGIFEVVLKALFDYFVNKLSRSFLNFQML